MKLFSKKIKTVEQEPSFETSWKNFSDWETHKIKVYHNVDKTTDRYYSTIIIDEEVQYVVEHYNKDKYRLSNGEENDLSELLGEIDQHWIRLCKLIDLVK